MARPAPSSASWCSCAARSAGLETENEILRVASHRERWRASQVTLRPQRARPKAIDQQTQQPVSERSARVAVNSAKGRTRTPCLRTLVRVP